jgi:Flp pilus assembly protein TadD
MSRRSLVILALLAALVRVVSVSALDADPGPVGVLHDHLLGDERAYDRWAREVADGGVERERAYYQAPLYPWLLGQLYRALPPEELRPEQSAVPHGSAHTVVLWGQYGLGVLAAVLTALLGARALSRRAGMLAGVMAAISGPLLFHETMLLKASVSIVVFLAALLLWLDVAEERGRRPLRQALVLGVVLGVGVMLRGNLLLLLGLVLLSLVLPLGATRRRPLTAVLVLAGALAALSPVTLHNLLLGDVVLSTYQSGTNAAIGNPAGDDPAHGIVYEPLRAGRGDAWFEEADAVALAEAGAGRELSGREISTWWWDEVKARWAEHPGTALRRGALKLVHLFHGAEVADVKDWAFVRRAVPWLATPLSDLSIWGPLALVGLLVLPWRRRPGLMVLRGGVAVVAVSLVLFYVMGRYRLSAAPCLWILAGGVLDRWAGLFSEARRGRLASEASAGAVLVMLGLQIPLPSDPGGDHLSWTNAASVRLFQAESASDEAEARAARDQAVEWARRSADIAPAFPAARRMLVRALSAASPVLQPRRDEAWDAAWRLLLLMESLRTVGDPPRDVLEASLPQVRAATLRLVAMASRPGGDAFTGPLLGWAARCVAQELRGGEDDHVLALDLIDHSLALDPDEALAHVQRGLFLKRLGRLADAEVAYRQALALGADTVELHNNLGNVLLDLGRATEAEASFREGLRVAPGDPVVTRNLERARSAQ